MSDLGNTPSVYNTGKYFAPKVLVREYDNVSVDANRNSKKINVTDRSKLLLDYSGYRDSGTSFASPFAFKDINRASLVPARNVTPAIPDVPKGKSWFSSNPSVQTHRHRKYEPI
jgi:hypothetical protein